MVSATVVIGAFDGFPDMWPSLRYRICGIQSGTVIEGDTRLCKYEDVVLANGQPGYNRLGVEEGDRLSDGLYGVRVY